MFKYTSSKRRAKENLHPLLDDGGNIVTKDEKRSEVLNAFFASVANSEDYPVVQRVPSPLNRKTVMGSRKKAPITQREMVSDLLNHSEMKKSTGQISQGSLGSWQSCSPNHFPSSTSSFTSPVRSQLTGI